MSVIEPARWGAGKRIPKCLEYISRYGSSAREFLPQLQQMRQQMSSAKNGEEGESVQALDKAIARITSDTATLTMVDLKDFIANSKAARTAK
jgi:hypothetical protein